MRFPKAFTLLLLTFKRGLKVSQTEFQALFKAAPKIFDDLAILVQEQTKLL